MQDATGRRNAMEPYQERVIQEKKELDEKIAKLEALLNSHLWWELPILELDRMRRQQRHMRDYATVLGERIATFTESSKP
jgi:hypothetical protein